MESSNTQLRVTIPLKLQGHLQTKASRYGLSLSAYVKNLIINDVREDAPVYSASEITEKAYSQAKKAEKEGALIKGGEVEDFLENL